MSYGTGPRYGWQCPTCGKQGAITEEQAKGQLPIFCSPGFGGCGTFIATHLALDPDHLSVTWILHPHPAKPAGAAEARGVHAVRA